MHVRYQAGYLGCVTRKNGTSRWEFLWRENGPSGKRTRRTAMIGTLEQYPTEELARAAVTGLRVSINEDRNRQRAQSILVADLVDHYIRTELSETAEWHSHATKIVYSEYLRRWIKPRWATINVRVVRSVAVENWLRRLRRKDGDPLADGTKAKIRNLMSVLFNHAIRYEWLAQGANPIALVRQSARGQRIPAVLEPSEIHNLLSELASPFRLMVLLDATTGLRRSELFALRWSDIDFSNLTIDISRNIYQRVIGKCKTEASRKPVPLAAYVAANLWSWKEESHYSQLDDWVFASPHSNGQYPYWPDILLAKIIRPAAERGIKKRIGWHTFRHTYSTLLVANGENVKVAQELMRHANSRCTLDIYSQAQITAKRDAQQRIVQMIVPQEQANVESEVHAAAPARLWRILRQSFQQLRVMNGAFWSDGRSVLRG
jgi:integrase